MSNNEPHTFANNATAAHAVSVVVPTYNVEQYLEQCLRSIRSCLGTSLQLIIVNDGSTDASAQIAQRFVEHCEREHEADPMLPDACLITKPNGGYGAAVNTGFAAADGTYVGIVEPDDFLDGDLFGELFAIAQACDMPDVVKSTYKRVWMPDTPEQHIWSSLLKNRGVRTWQNGCTNLGESPLLVRWHPSVWSAIYRRDFLEQSNTRFLEVPGAGWVDNPFVMRALCQAKRIAFTNDAWYCYREDRPGSSSVLKTADLSLTRWLQMAQEVKASPWVNNEGVQQSLASIGFRYASHLWDTPALDNPHTRKLLKQVLCGMNPAAALSLKDVSPTVKQRYLDETGYAGNANAAGGMLAYRCAMLRELVYSWRENGLFFACERAGLHRHAANSQPNA